MGTTSITRTRGTIVSSGAQKVRMPVRVIATSAAKPDRMTSATSSQVRGRDLGHVPNPSRFSMPVSMANLAMKPGQRRQAREQESDAAEGDAPSTASAPA